MRIAHNCFRCGSDLSGLRAPPDPHYHLPVVVCPRCAAACVRTRPEAVAIQREFMRLFYAGSRLAFQIGFTAFFAGATLAGTRTLSAGLFRTGLAIPLEGWLTLGSIVLTVLGTALWLGSCFPHWKRPALLLAWVALLLALPLFGAMHAAGETLSGPRVLSPIGGLGGTVREYLNSVATEFRSRRPMVPALALLATLEVALSPLGVALLRLNRVLLRLKARRRRRVLRHTRGHP